MLYHPGKIAAFGRLTLARGIAAVVVGFPATPLLTSRARICISAAHTREDLDRAIAALQEVAEECGLKYNVSPRLAVRQPLAVSGATRTDSGCVRLKSEGVAPVSMQEPLQLDYQPGWGDAKSNGFMNGDGPGHKHNLIS